MIESRFWKEELVRISKTLRPVKKPRRWSERALCTLERDVMIGFFIVRSMIELHKITDKVASMKVPLFSAPAIREVNSLTDHRLEENYDWSEEREELRPLRYVANQFVHAYLSYVFRDETRNWSEILIVSDYDRNNVIWRVLLSDIRSCFEEVGNNTPTGMSARYDPTKRDHVWRVY